MTIQAAVPDDLDDVRDLLRTVNLPHQDLTLGHLEHFLVARDGEGLCGVVGLELYGEAALLRSLSVSPEHQNEGLGTRLVEAVEHHARQQDIRTLYLLTTTVAGYFRVHGYDPLTRDKLPESVQETEEAARLCPSNATCMRKKLSGTHS